MTLNGFSQRAKTLEVCGPKVGQYLGSSQTPLLYHLQHVHNIHLTVTGWLLEHHITTSQDSILSSRKGGRRRGLPSLTSLSSVRKVIPRNCPTDFLCVSLVRELSHAYSCLKLQGTMGKSVSSTFPQDKGYTLWGGAPASWKLLPPGPWQTLTSVPLIWSLP